MIVASSRKLDARVILYLDMDGPFFSSEANESDEKDAVLQIEEETPEELEALEEAELQGLARSIAASVFGRDSEEGAARIAIGATMIQPMVNWPNMLIQIWAFNPSATGDLTSAWENAAKRLLNRLAETGFYLVEGLELQVEIMYEGEAMVRLAVTLQADPVEEPVAAG